VKALLFTSSSHTVKALLFARRRHTSSLSRRGRARAKTGKRIAAKIAMIAITTRSSIKVKAFFIFLVSFEE
jgi:hypothetical protein